MSLVMVLAVALPQWWPQPLDWATRLQYAPLAHRWSQPLARAALLLEPLALALPVLRRRLFVRAPLVQRRSNPVVRLALGLSLKAVHKRRWLEPLARVLVLH